MKRNPTKIQLAHYVKKNYQQEQIDEDINYTEFDRGINNLERQKIQLFDKAINSNDPNIIQKAQDYFITNKQQSPMTGQKIKSMLVDPLEFASSFGYKDKPTRLTYMTLQRMASTPFPAITINTRISQILKFCIPQPDEYSIGFKIRMRDRKAKPTKEDEKNIEQLTQIIIDDGRDGYRWGRDDFEEFMAHNDRHLFNCLG